MDDDVLRVRGITVGRLKKILDGIPDRTPIAFVYWQNRYDEIEARDFEIDLHCKSIGGRRQVNIEPWGY